MSTQLLPKPADTDTGDDRLMHWVCAACYPIPAPGNVALCGHVCKDGKMRHRQRTDLLCVVCDDLVEKPCQKCGAIL